MHNGGLAYTTLFIYFIFIYQSNMGVYVVVDKHILTQVCVYVCIICACSWGKRTNSKICICDCKSISDTMSTKENVISMAVFYLHKYMQIYSFTYNRTLFISVVVFIDLNTTKQCD